MVLTVFFEVNMMSICYISADSRLEMLTSPNETKMHVYLPYLPVYAIMPLSSGLKPWFRTQSPFVRYRNSRLFRYHHQLMLPGSKVLLLLDTAKEILSFSVVASEASIKQQAAMVWTWFDLQQKMRKRCCVWIYVQRFCMFYLANFYENLNAPTFLDEKKLPHNFVRQLHLGQNMLNISRQT